MGGPFGYTAKDQEKQFQNLGGIGGWVGRVTFLNFLVLISFNFLIMCLMIFLSSEVCTVLERRWVELTGLKIIKSDFVKIFVDNCVYMKPLYLNILIEIFLSVKGKNR